MTFTSKKQGQRRRWRYVLARASSVVVIALGSGPSFGQARDPAAARTLFQEGRALVSQGRYEQACTKFEESLQLDSGIGTQFNLADCWEHIGRTASAWSLFLDVAARAKSSAQTDREGVARARATALEPRLSRLTIRVEATDPGIEVRKNDIAVGRALFGVATPVDPGSYVIEARSRGKRTWTKTVVIASGAPATTVLVPELESEPSPTNETTAKSAPSKPSQTAAPIIPALSSEREPESGGGSNGQRTAGWIVGAAGFAGVGVGATFAWLTKLSDRRAAALCTGGAAANQCSSESEKIDLQQTIARANNRAMVSYVGFIGGGAALVTGAILLLTAGSSDAAHRQDRKAIVLPIFGSSTVGFEVSSDW